MKHQQIKTVINYCLTRAFATSIISLYLIGRSQNSSDIYSKIQKLNVLGSLLHIGAHPDDENTSLISYFSNKYQKTLNYEKYIPSY